jgi:hypothetical protein
MTPARKAALQWFHDRGEVKLRAGQEGQPSHAMIMAMRRDGHLQWRDSSPWVVLFSLTDKGRRALHGDDK